MFANETIKGLTFIDLISQKYDVVATNPPYMYTRTMGQSLKDFLEIYYLDSKYDLYSAFIRRNMDFISFNSYIAMITQHSFMFLAFYEKLRCAILDNFWIRTMAHLGPHAFEDIGGEKVNTTMFSISSRDPNRASLFIKLIDLESPQEKGEYIKNIANLYDSPRVLSHYQTDFEKIPSSPIIYSISDNIRDSFSKYDPLDDESENSKATPKCGLATCNNDMFLRFWWEINDEMVGIKWFPYMKGGKYNKWYGNND
ncbi:unnamed protein product, partial [marine sediment metagenome]